MTEPKLTTELPKSPYDLWPDESTQFETPPPAVSEPETRVTGAFNEATDSSNANPFGPQTRDGADMEFDSPFEAPFVPVAYTPELSDQTVRNSGLAWSAGIVFFGAVVFMLFLGWLADWLLGSSPYGIVIGIVLGSIIGFIQFFRISSQIFSGHKPDPDHRPLLTRHDEEER